MPNAMEDLLKLTRRAAWECEFALEAATSTGGTSMDVGPWLGGQTPSIANLREDLQCFHNILT